MAGNLVSQVRTMLVVGRRLTKAGGRYFIYLPVEYNEVWEHWHENEAVLRMVIEVVEFKKANSEKSTQPNSNIQPY
jgi:predicted transcriptional regulator